jgi:hypothetical protein
MEAVGQLDDGDRADLRAHIDGCPPCQTDRHELSRVVGALARVDGPMPGDLFVPADLSKEAARPATLDADVLEMLSAMDSRSRRRHLAWVAGAVAAVVVAVVGTLGLLHPAPAGSRTVALHGRGGNYGTALLVPEPWGTSIRLSDHGEPIDRELVVSMRTEYGGQWVAGTYRSKEAGEMNVTLACALPVQQISSISVTDTSGRMVLHS